MTAKFSYGKAGEDHLAEEGDLGGLIAGVREPHLLAIELHLVHVWPLSEPDRQRAGASQDADLDGAVRRLLPLNLGNRTDGQQLAALDDADLIAHFGQFGENVRADEY